MISQSFSSVEHPWAVLLHPHCSYNQQLKLQKILNLWRWKNEKWVDTTDKNKISEPAPLTAGDNYHEILRNYYTKRHIFTQNWRHLPGPQWSSGEDKKCRLLDPFWPISGCVCGRFYSSPSALIFKLMDNLKGQLLALYPRTRNLWICFTKFNFFGKSPKTKAKKKVL